jgi:hypothetical protein
MEKKSLLKVLLLSTVIVLSSCKKDNTAPVIDPVLDCDGVDAGTAMLDDCGTCQKAYIYNTISHAVTFLDDATGVEAGDNEMVIMPNDASNPYWNSSCYTYTVDGWVSSTVAYGGQTARLDMASEMMSAIATNGTTVEALMGMFENTGGYFSNADLNASTKQIKSKTAASNAVSSTAQIAIHASFDSWFLDYATNVAPIVGTTTTAAAGSAGMAGNRELNAKGMEYDQIVAKSLIGALCLDQVVNGYLSDSKIGDAVNNVDRTEDNNSTAREHHFDEGFGYVYGKFGADNIMGDLSGDGLLGKYLNKYDDYKATVFNAFVAGRAAIVSENSNVRDEQAQIIKETLSMVVAKRAESYLRSAAGQVDLSPEYFHDLSEGYGFILSLQFTYTADGTPYFSHEEVNTMLEALEAGNGFWDRTDAELISMADEINAVTGL